MLTIYKASAGSGKTYNLALEYIKLLLGEKDKETGLYRLRKSHSGNHRHILAVTFTNKATEEMKRRIVKELSILSGIYPDQEATSSYTKELTSTLRCAPADLKAAAGSALKNLLFDFSFFNVSTIDSFFQTILRTFAREAELTGNYEIELDKDEAIAEGVHRFFNSLGQEREGGESRRLIDRLTRYLESRLREGHNVMIFNREGRFHSELISIIAGLSDETFTRHSAELQEFFSNPKAIDTFEEAVFNMSARPLARARGLLSAAVDATVRADSLLKSGAINARFSKSLAALAEDPDKKSSYVDSILQNGAACVFKDAYRRHIAANPQDDISAVLEEAMAAVMLYRGLNTLSVNLRNQTFYLSLMQETYRFIEEYRNENNFILLNDTNTLIHTIIGQEETPFLYERLGLMLRHYLIDEFQDTSRMQWSNLEPLIRESIGNNDDNLIIGDEKQCIYRYRNSDPTLLQSEVPAAFRGDTLMKGANANENTNWRSSAEVVRFNNTFFHTLAEAEAPGEIYANVDQLVAPVHATHRGYVQIRCHDTKSAADFLEESVRFLAADIDRQLDSGYIPGEIAILVRGKAEGRRIIAALTAMQDENARHRYSIVSDDLTTIGQSAAVRLIISHLRNLTTEAVPGQEDARQRKFRTKGDIAAMLSRFEISSADGSPFAQAIEEAVSGSGTPTRVNPESLTLTDIIEDIIATIPEGMRSGEASHICAFQDMVLDYLGSGLSDLNSFLRWWDTSGSSTIVSAPENPGAVRVMTIHKSKGLEFSCVHIPYANWEILRFRSPEWFETAPLAAHLGAEVEMPPVIPVMPSSALAGTPFGEQYGKICTDRTVDEINVLYVALTRAVDELCVQYCPSTGKMGGIIDDTLRSAFPDKEFVADADPQSGALSDQVTTLTFGTPGEPWRKEEGADPFAPSVSPMPSYFPGGAGQFTLCVDDDPEDE